MLLLCYLSNSCSGRFDRLNQLFDLKFEAGSHLRIAACTWNVMSWVELVCVVFIADIADIGFDDELVAHRVFSHHICGGERWHLESGTRRRLAAAVI